MEDDAWDTRMGVGGSEDPYGPGPGGYYEEQELGLAPTPGLHAPEPYRQGDYVGAGYSRSAAPGAGAGAYITPPADEGRGRSKSREPPVVAAGGTRNLDPNPFGDHHEAASLRSVSPRPEIDTSVAGGASHTKGQGSLDSQTSPVSRTSAFREGL